MKYQLRVSYDCGTHYGLEAEADDVMEFAERCKELDDSMLRWAIADEDGKDIAEPQFICRIFREIFATIEVARLRENTKPFYEEEARRQARGKGGPPG